MAFDYSIYVFNNIPSSDGLAPEEKWSGVKFHDYNHLWRMHPWGCPCYVLDLVLQNGKKLPKWRPQSRLGKYVGPSKEHATNAGLVLNSLTKWISAQFHMLFDNIFSTVCRVDDCHGPVLTKTDWDSLFHTNGTDMYYDPLEPNPELHPPPVDNKWLDPDEIEGHARDLRVHREQRPQREQQPQSEE